MPVTLRIAAWLFIVEGCYYLVLMLLTYSGYTGPNVIRSSGYDMLFVIANVVAGVGLLFQKFWARSIGVFYSGAVVIWGIISFFWNFGGSPALLLTIAGQTAAYGFQFWVLVFGTSYSDYER